MRGSYLHNPGGHLGISHRKGISLTKPVKKGVYTAGLTPRQRANATVHRQATDVISMRGIEQV